MFKAIHLHIGMPKTATTAFQEWLIKERDALYEAGFYLHSPGPAHVFLAALASKTPEDIYIHRRDGNPSPDSVQKLNRILDADFKAASGQHNDKICLLSCEHLVLFDQDEMTRLATYLAKFSPVIKVFVVIRNPADLFRSYHLERVKHGFAILDQPSGDNYLSQPEILDRVADAFGAHTLKVLPYGPESLKDLAVEMGITSLSPCTGQKVNTALSGAALMLYDALNIQFPQHNITWPKGRSRTLVLDDISGSRHPDLSIPPEIRDAILKDTEKLQQEFDFGMSPEIDLNDPRQPRGQLKQSTHKIEADFIEESGQGKSARPAPIWSRQTIKDTALLINRLFLENERLRAENTALKGDKLLAEGNMVAAKDHYRYALTLDPECSGALAGTKRLLNLTPE